MNMLGFLLTAVVAAIIVASARLLGSVTGWEFGFGMIGGALVSLYVVRVIDAVRAYKRRDREVAMMMNTRHSYTHDYPRTHKWEM